VDEISFEYSPGVKSSYNVSALIGKSGITLFDTGMPGSSKQIEKYFDRVGHEFSDIKQIVLTHLDNDHIGSAPEIKKQTNAKVIMHRLDAKLATEKSIEKGDVKKMFPTYKNDELERLMEKIASTKDIDLNVDEKVGGGEEFSVLDQDETIRKTVRMIHTPGHTPGHCCAYIASESMLISGDALSAKAGKDIQDPVPIYTANMTEARDSLRNLDKLGLGFERLISYHDPPILSSASTRLKEYLQSIRAP
jgi:glyoxylase-like metal-dependent hydrolase (beta-lactamase superfamily II)